MASRSDPRALLFWVLAIRGPLAVEILPRASRKVDGVLPGRLEAAASKADGGPLELLRPFVSGCYASPVAGIYTPRQTREPEVGIQDECEALAHVPFVGIPIRENGEPDSGHLGGTLYR